MNISYCGSANTAAIDVVLAILTVCSNTLCILICFELNLVFEQLKQAVSSVFRGSLMYFLTVVVPNPREYQGSSVWLMSVNAW